MADIDQHPHRVLTLLNYEKLFADSPGAVIINDGAFLDRQTSKVFSEYLLTNIDGILGYAPSCKCGNVHGLASEGEYCPLCDSVSSTKFVDKLNHSVWIGIPEGMPKVLHPFVYNTLKGLISVKCYSKRTQTTTPTPFIDAILDPDVDVSNLPSPLIDIFHGDYVRNRGFAWLRENIDEVIDAFAMYCTDPKRCANKIEAGLALKPWLDLYRDAFFTSRLPVLHSSLHPAKTSGDNRYDVDTVSRSIMQAIADLSAEDFKRHSTYVDSKRQKISLYKIYRNMAEYYENIVKVKLGGKKSLLRQHCLGSRLNFTFRSVVAAQDEILPLDEICLPWGIMVKMFELVLLNMLTHRHNLSFKDATDRINLALVHYDKLIDRCLSDFLKDYPNMRLPVILGRNPTLAVGSISNLFVRKYKTDPHDETIAVNACVIEPANADFDGDEMYGMVLLEDVVAQAMTAVHPSQLQFSVARPGLSTSIGPLKQNFICLENWLDSDPATETFVEC